MIYQRRGIYHTDFMVNGYRFRQTLETKKLKEAKSLEKTLIARAEEGKLASGVTAEFSRMSFSLAAARYLNERTAVVLPATTGQERSHFKRMGEFFGAKRLNQIRPDDIGQYQARRLAQGKHKNTINHEVKALLRLLKRAKLASHLRDDVKLLPVKREPRRILAQAEKQRLFETAASKDEWRVAYCAALLTANTSMRPVELRRMEWQDLDRENRVLIIRRSKTEAGTRMIPLNDEAWSAVVALKERADKIGTAEAEHHVFPRLFMGVDGMRSMGPGGWRSAWRSIRDAAAVGNPAKGKPAMPQLAKFRYYDLRHQCITEMLEAGIPEGVIREVAGHIDPAMTRLYSHPRLAARRAAVESLMMSKPSRDSEKLDGGYVTNHVTNELPEHSSVG